jgi:hypothetical protein
MTNHLAVELRQLVDDLDNTPPELIYSAFRGRLLSLAVRVERLGNQPAEQEIRARALDAVARLFTGAPPTMFGATELAEDFADWIRDGARP